MIMYIAILDGKHVFNISDNTIPVGETMHLLAQWQLPEFISEFPDLPWSLDINSVSYETENNIYHVSYNDSSVVSFPTHLGHPLLEWMHNNKDEIVSKGLLQTTVQNSEGEQ